MRRLPADRLAVAARSRSPAPPRARTRSATSPSTTSTRGRASPPDRVDVRYVLDQAEIPTFQERGLSRAAA